MEKNTTSKRRRPAVYQAIGVAGLGLFLAHVFLHANPFLLLLSAGIVLWGIAGWISTSKGKFRENRARTCVLEIVGRPGIVVQECSPEGKVRIGDTTWSAVSSDGLTLKVGEKITVQDMRELKLTVKAEPSAIPVHH